MTVLKIHHLSSSSLGLGTWREITECYLIGYCNQRNHEKAGIQVKKRIDQAGKKIKKYCTAACHHPHILQPLVSIAFKSKEQ